MRVIRAGNTDPVWKYPEHLEEESTRDWVSDFSWLITYLTLLAVIAAIVSYALISLRTPYVAYEVPFFMVVLYVSSIIVLVISVAGYIIWGTINTKRIVLLSLAVFAFSHYLYIYSVVSVRELTVIILPFVMIFKNSEGYGSLMIDMGQISILILVAAIAHVHWRELLRSRKISKKRYVEN